MNFQALSRKTKNSVLYKTTGFFMDCIKIDLVKFNLRWFSVNNAIKDIEKMNLDRASQKEIFDWELDTVLFPKITTLKMYCLEEDHIHDERWRYKYVDKYTFKIKNKKGIQLRNIAECAYRLRGLEYRDTSFFKSLEIKTYSEKNKYMTMQIKFGTFEW